MKNKVILYLLITSIFYSCNVSNQPILKVHNSVYDFAKIDKADSVKGEFILENIGSGDLVIKNIAPSCNCTITSYEKKSILPGEKKAIGFVYKPSITYDTGKVEKEIVIQTNTEMQLHTLKIKGFVN
ncbi:DUF1573 domain-containing protein [Pedobacter hiemivivus]|nr:DUF1573 domain-containing protein [Pedobacter hiemivivus]